jgi:hypothetical protein
MNTRDQRNIQNTLVKVARGINIGLFSFGAIFFAAGLLVSFALIGPVLFTGIASQNWLPLEAELLEAGLHSSGGKSDTWQARGRYRYQVNGQVYENDRVALLTSSDNIGDFQQRLARELETALAAKRPVTIWYDPDNPADSVLNREIRWGMLAFVGIFLLFFGGMGLVLMLLALRGARKSPLGQTTLAEAIQAMQNRAAAKPQAPPQTHSAVWTLKPDTERPAQASGQARPVRPQRMAAGIQAGAWLKNPAWRSAQIQSNADQRLRIYWLSGGGLLLVGLVLVAFGDAIWPVMDQFDQLVQILLPLLALGILGAGLWKRMALRRHGIGHLSLDPFPGAISGELGGTIDLDLAFHPGMRAELTLSCLEWATEGRYNRGEALVWEAKGCAKILPTAKGSRSGFRFLIPEDLPETSMEKKGTFYIWRLELRLSSPRARLRRTFELPIFHTGAKSAHPQPLAREVCPELAAASDISRVLPLEQRGNMQRLYYPMGRKWGKALMAIAMGLAFMLPGFAQIGWNIGSARDDLLLFLISGILGLVMLLNGLWGLFNSLEVRMDGRVLVSCRRVLGIPVRCRELVYRELGAVVASRRVSAYRGGGQREIEYRVWVSSPKGRLTLAENIYIRHQAGEAQKFFEAEFHKAQRYQR